MWKCIRALNIAEFQISTPYLFLTERTFHNNYCLISQKLFFVFFFVNVTCINHSLTRKPIDKQRVLFRISKKFRRPLNILSHYSQRIENIMRVPGTYS